MLTSLITFPRRQPEAVPAVEAVPVPRTTTDNESAILEILQVVHDLRNQLTIMSLAADIPETSPIERERRLLDLHRAVERSVVLINALLMNERSSAADRTVDDANEVVRRTTATLSHASSQGVRVQLHLWAEPLPVSADVGDLDRVLLNLMLNAFDAMPSGGVLTVETAVTTARESGVANAASAYARMTVRDTGPGMTAELKDRIFDPFFTTKKGGTGLGLRSVAFTVQQLGGHIAVESEPGRGTAVTILLPLARQGWLLSFPAPVHPDEPRD